MTTMLNHNSKMSNALLAGLAIVLPEQGEDVAVSQRNILHIVIQHTEEASVFLAKSKFFTN